MSVDPQQSDLVNLLVQNLEKTTVEDTSTPHHQNGGNNNRKHSKPRKHGQYEQRNFNNNDSNGYSQFGMGTQYANLAQQDHRDREWAEYVQIMKLPVSGMHHNHTESQTSQPNATNYRGGRYVAPNMQEEEVYNEQDEAHFVQSFVQSPQFLPYQIPGYFQHPGFTSQLYSDGRMFPSNQLYPFGAQPYVAVTPENYQEQLQNNYSYGKPVQGGVVQGEVEGEENDIAVPLYAMHPAMGGIQMVEPSKQKKKQQQQQPTVPKSWADIANTPAMKQSQPPKPKEQPQQPKQPQQPQQPQQVVLTKQQTTTKVEEKGKQQQPAPKKVPGKLDISPQVTKGIVVSSTGDVVNDPDAIDLNPSYARFFVIKSYSEDDVHKAIKYKIWASTDSGNRRLDTAFKETAGKGPIYLFFSVNASGQFCGMAQMLTALDYEKKSDVWAQDKWNGMFQVKWIFIKDIPNNQLRHIRLENNENKPVTNSRDTQEIFLEPGKEMLRIFATYKAKSSIMDDFDFYDQRQSAMKEKKLKSPEEANSEETDVITGSQRSQRKTATHQNNNRPRHAH